jgi:hypothetical protein
MSEPVTVHAAAQRRGVSTSTIHRLIAKGELDAEVEPRPQGTRYMVRFPSPEEAAAEVSPDTTRRSVRQLWSAYRVVS